MSTQPQLSIDDVDQWFEEEEGSQDVVQESAPDPEQKYRRSQLRVVRETKDYQLDYLRLALVPDRELIDVAPAYQRRLRWNRKKKSLLIESFLLNIPVPPIYLFESDYNAYEVIDGRQRLETIRGFLNNQFALTSLEYWPELNRKRFDDLPQVLKKGLLRRSLSAVVLLAETHSSQLDDRDLLDVRRVLFDRLNTGGVGLNPQELRNSLYHGSLNAMLIRLARSPFFTAVWGIPSWRASEDVDPPDDLLKNALFSTMADAELVLRFFALKDAYRDEETGSLRLILDRYMKNNRDLDEAEVRAAEDDFERSLQRLIGVFDGETFRLPTGRPSRPLYDALMIALSLSPDIAVESHAAAIRAAMADALRSEVDYEILVGRGNTIKAVRERVELADEILRSE